MSRKELAILSQYEKSFQEYNDELTTIITTTTPEAPQQQPKTNNNNDNDGGRKMKTKQHGQDLHVTRILTLEAKQMLDHEKQRIKREYNQLQIKSNMLWAKTANDQKTPLMKWCEEVRSFTSKKKTMPDDVIFAHDSFCLSDRPRVVQFRFNVTSRGCTRVVKIRESSGSTVTSSTSIYVKDFNALVAAALSANQSCVDFFRPLGLL